jgi:hypothetical protein
MDRENRYSENPRIILPLLRRDRAPKADVVDRKTEGIDVW